MDFRDIRKGEKLILNIHHLHDIGFDGASWMSRYADKYGDIPVMVDMLDEADPLDVLVFPSEELTLINNRKSKTWWVSSKCLHKMCTEFHSSDDLDSLFKDM